MPYSINKQENLKVNTRTTRLPSNFFTSENNLPPNLIHANPDEYVTQSQGLIAQPNYIHSTPKKRFDYIYKKKKKCGNGGLLL